MKSNDVIKASFGDDLGQNHFPGQKKGILILKNLGKIIK